MVPTPAPRIYNLFPLLAGPIPRWRDHLDRIEGMGFDWIYLNPIQYPGFSGSLYAIKDLDGFHPLLIDGTGGDPAGTLRAFLREAEARGIRVLIDLVVNHTSRDALLVEQHPEWYQRDDDGEIRSPFAIDPADASKKTVWGDLAELNYGDPEARRGLVTYFSRWIGRQIELGFAGFRCDAAYKVPAEVWSELIASARNRRRDLLFCAETLGCRLEEVAAVASAGFDYLFNSSKWWDFRESWAIEQYEAHRRIAPSISFPETHDTPRLAAESGGREEILRGRYLFAAFFSTAVMMPLGYEYGFRRQVDVVRSRPEDWETPTVDLTGFIAEVHRMKKAEPTLNEEGPLQVVGGMAGSQPQLPDPAAEPVVRLLKKSERGGRPVLAWIHPGEEDAQAPVEEACRVLGAAPDQVRVISPDRECGPLPARTGNRGTDKALPDVHRHPVVAGVDSRVSRPLAPWEVRLLAAD